MGLYPYCSSQTGSRKDGPPGRSARRYLEETNMAKKLSYNHKEMLRKRGRDPKNYVFLKNTYTTVYFRDIRTGKILPVLKYGNT
jgi:hypothetical protein